MQTFQYYSHPAEFPHRKRQTILKHTFANAVDTFGQLYFYQIITSRKHIVAQLYLFVAGTNATLANP